MLSQEDINQKQIIFINTTQYKETKIQFLADNLVYKSEGKNINKISVHKIFSIYIIGNITITNQLIKHCLEHGISIFLLTSNLSVYCQINNNLSAHYLLRQRQYALSENKNLELAKKIVVLKLTNQLSSIKKTLTAKKQILKEIKDKITKTQDVSSLRGIEGYYSKLYFKDIFKDMDYKRRLPRVKPDIVNTLQDIGYTYLLNFIDSLLILYGFDNYKGFYHTLFFQRKSLACDIMEPFRYLIDQKIVKMHNLKQVDPQHFKKVGFNIQLQYKHSAIYSKHFFETIQDNKAEIHKFVKEFYLHILKPEIYSIKTRYLSNKNK